MEKFIVGGRHYYWTAAPINPGLQFCGCNMGEHLCTSLEILWGRASSCVLTPACMYCSSSSSSSSSSAACTVKGPNPIFWLWKSISTFHTQFPYPQWWLCCDTHSGRSYPYLKMLQDVALFFIFFFFFSFFFFFFFFCCCITCCSCQMCVHLPCMCNCPAS